MGDMSAVAVSIAMGVPEHLLDEVLEALQLRRCGLHREAQGQKGAAKVTSKIERHELEALCDRVETLPDATEAVKAAGRGVWQFFLKHGQVTEKQVAMLGSSWSTSRALPQECFARSVDPRGPERYE